MRLTHNVGYQAGGCRAAYGFDAYAKLGEERGPEWPGVEDETGLALPLQVKLHSRRLAG